MPELPPPGPAAAGPAPALPEPGGDFAGYRILGILGKGRTSVVYQAGNPRLGNVIALKVLVPELAAHDVFRTRFFEESRIAAALNHPHVVPIHDMGSAGGLLYIAMRQVSGTDLRRLLSESRYESGFGRLAPDRAVALLAQAARALDAAHRMGLVHRDVKPGNLLVERGGEQADDHLYLADFGITKVMSSQTGLTSPGEFVGTVDYIAPEQIRGISVMGMADQYSLACVLYECLTGRVPFRRDVDAAVIFAHVEEPPVPPSALCPDLPPAIDRVIARALAKQPGDRYGTCREFTDAAASALNGATPAPGTLLPEARAPEARAPEAPVPEARVAETPAPQSRAVAEIAHRGDTGAIAHDQVPDPRGEWEKPLSVRDKRVDRRWPAVVAGLLVIAAGASAWFFLRGGHPAHADTTPMPMSRQHAPTPLMAALAQANTITGKVPPRRCTQRGAARVTCLTPVPGVSEAVFQTYPSLAALYGAYETAMKSLDGGRVEQNTQDCGLTAPPVTGGETGWNHQFDHPHSYTITQMAAGKVGVAQAAGRVFCVLNTRSGLTEFVWTQDDGRVLGWVAGPLHEQVWDWWLTVHHEIAIGKPPMSMPAMQG